MNEEEFLKDLIIDDFTPITTALKETGEKTEAEDERGNADE